MIEVKPKEIAFPESNTKYSASELSTVRSLLADCDLPRDALPYTSRFNDLRAKFEREAQTSVSEHRFWQMMSRAGKMGGLAPAGRKKKAQRAASLTEEEQLEILRLFPDGIGNRDHLPYTPKFDEIHRRFGRLTGKRLDKHEFWRAVSRVAKLSRKPKPLFSALPPGGLDSELLEFIDRQNPWWKAEPTRRTERFRRWAFAEVVDRLKSGLAKIVVIRGSRRVGKSVIQNQLVEQLLQIEHVHPARLFYLQFDVIPKLGTMTQPILTLVKWYEDNVLKCTLNTSASRGQPAYLLFDEVQNLPEWSVQLKALVDQTDVKMLITGSSAMRLGEGKDNLAGRMTTIELGPLRLAEIAGIRGLRELPAFDQKSDREPWKTRKFWLSLIEHGQKHEQVRKEAYHWFSALGGYPLCHSTDEKDINKIRQQIVDEVVTKTITIDPSHRAHSASLDVPLITEVFRLACRYAGESPRPKILADEIRARLQSSISETKINGALTFLADSLLLQMVPPFEGLGKRQSHPSKICLCDHFVRDGFLQETLPLDPKALEACDEAVSGRVGHLLESVIGYYLRGVPGLDLSWFPARSQESEIDFIVTIGTDRIPLEVKYRRSAPSLADVAGIEAFCKKQAYSASFGLIVTQTFAGEVGQYAIALPASTLLLLR